MLMIQKTFHKNKKINVKHQSYFWIVLNWLNLSKNIWALILHKGQNLKIFVKIW